jgi:hypothetical protein
MGGLNNGKEGGAEVRSLKLGGHVGFDSMPDQLVNKSVQNGFCFNILSIGETGIGKSTLADSLFNTRKEAECYNYVFFRFHLTFLFFDLGKQHGISKRGTCPFFIYEKGYIKN